MALATYFVSRSQNLSLKLTSNRTQTLTLNLLIGVWGALFFTFNPSKSLAQVFPLRGDTDVILLEDPRVDFSLRFEKIKKAQTIDILTFSFTSDKDIGLPFAMALREAAFRGAKIRLIFDAVASRFEADASSGIENRWNITKTLSDGPMDFTYLITDSSLKRPAQVFWIDADWKWSNGLKKDDFLHEKIMILDRGLPSEMIFFGSRNISASALRGMDFALILRPIQMQNISPQHNPQLNMSSAQTTIGTDIQTYFDQLWSLLEQNGKHPVKIEPLPRRLQKLIATRAFPIDLTLGIPQAELELRAISKVLDHPAQSTDAVISAWQFRPKSAQLLSNDLFPQLFYQRSIGNSDAENFDARKHLIQDDVVHVLSKLISNSKDIALSTFTVSFPEQMKSALQASLTQGANVSIFTNGLKAHSANKSTLGIGSIAMDLTFISLLDGFFTFMPSNKPLMTDESKTSLANLKVYLLDYDKVSQNFYSSSDYPWLHRKWIAMDQWVAIGAHNFTESSSYKNNEVMILFDDPALSRVTRNIFSQKSKSYYDQISKETVLNAVHNPSLGHRTLKKLLLETVREIY